MAWAVETWEKMMWCAAVVCWLAVGLGLFAYGLPDALENETFRSWDVSNLLAFVLCGVLFAVCWPLFLADWILEK